jgi:hypothetical protein
MSRGEREPQEQPLAEFLVGDDRQTERPEEFGKADRQAEAQAETHDGWEPPREAVPAMVEGFPRAFCLPLYSCVSPQSHLQWNHFTKGVETIFAL